MTATVPQASRAATPPGGPTAVRLGTVYGYNILDPVTGQVVADDYIGQTVRPLAARDRQHRGLAPNRDGTTWAQPWSDLIVGAPHVLEQGWWTAEQLNERERHWIRVKRPRFNHEWNLDNPARIPIPEARRQRALRDATRIVPSAPVVARRSVWRWLRGTSLGVAVEAWLLQAARAAVVWAGLTAGLALLLAAPLGVRDGTGLAGVGAAVVMWRLRPGRPKRTRSRPRQRRRATSKARQRRTGRRR